MSLPSSEYIPPEEDRSLPPARRRKRRRSLVPQAAGERSTFLEELAHRLTPSADYFLFSAVCGLLPSDSPFIIPLPGTAGINGTVLTPTPVP